MKKIINLIIIFIIFIFKFRFSFALTVFRLRFTKELWNLKMKIMKIIINLIIIFILFIIFIFPGFQKYGNFRISATPPKWFALGSALAMVAGSSPASGILAQICEGAIIFHFAYLHIHRPALLPIRGFGPGSIAQQPGQRTI